MTLKEVAIMDTQKLNSDFINPRYRSSTFSPVVFVILNGRIAKAQN
jgi:hypothetical protein